VTPPLTLLDTDTLAAIMERQPNVIAQARAYLAVHRQLSFSLLTRYEIMRSLPSKNATPQLVRFERFCAASTVLPLTDAIAVRASIIYAYLHQADQLISDASILIAATAIEHAMMLATCKMHQYQRIPGLQLVNWLL
jgi:tRNA(fMet)-specific endonuclease VapC